MGYICESHQQGHDTDTGGGDHVKNRATDERHARLCVILRDEVTQTKEREENITHRPIPGHHTLDCNGIAAMVIYYEPKSGIQLKLDVHCGL